MSGNTFFSAARYGWHLQMKFGCAILDELCTKHLQYNRAVVVNRQFIYLYLQYGWMLMHVFLCSLSAYYVVHATVIAERDSVCLSTLHARQ